MSAETARVEEKNKVIPLCGCGCGKNVSRSARNKNMWNKYVHGHNGRGIPRPEHVREKISKSHMGIGKGERRSPSTEFKPGQRISPKTEFKPGHAYHLGRKRSDEFKQRMVARYKNQRYKVACDFCGKPISATMYQVKHSDHMFCNRQCAASYFSGENNNKWRGGITEENKRIRGSSEMLLWKKAVMERDGYLCYMCGDAGQLHAHHIKSFATHKDLRFDISNGITLCPECHGWCHAENVEPIVYKISELLGII